jgi:hypothetical protein
VDTTRLVRKKKRGRKGFDQLEAYLREKRAVVLPTLLDALHHALMSGGQYVRFLMFSTQTFIVYCAGTQPGTWLQNTYSELGGLFTTTCRWVPTSFVPDDNTDSLPKMVREEEKIREAMLEETDRGRNFKGCAANNLANKPAQRAPGPRPLSPRPV